MKLRIVKHLTVARLNHDSGSGAERVLNSGDTVEIVLTTGPRDQDQVFFRNSRDGLCSCRKCDLFAAATPLHSFDQ